MMSAGDESASPEEVVVVHRLDVLKQKLLDAVEDCWTNSAPPPDAGETSAAAAERNNYDALDRGIAERDSARRREAALMEEARSVRSHLDACSRDLAETNRSTAQKMQSLAAENGELKEKIAKHEESRTLAMGLLVFFFYYFEFDVLGWSLLAVLLYDKVVKKRFMRGGGGSSRRTEEQKRDLEAGTPSSSSGGALLKP